MNRKKPPCTEGCDACASVSTSAPSDARPEVTVSSDGAVGGCWLDASYGGDCEDPGRCYVPVCSNVGIGEARYEFEVTGNGWAQVVVSATFRAGFGRSDGPEVLVRQGVLFGLSELWQGGTELWQAGYVASVGDYEAGFGATYDPVDGQWTIDLTAGCDPGVQQVTDRQFRFTEDGMDVDESGRFNQLDVYALEGLMGSTDPDDLKRWDFDGDGVID